MAANRDINADFRLKTSGRIDNDIQKNASEIKTKISSEINSGAAPEASQRIDSAMTGVGKDIRRRTDEKEIRERIDDKTESKTEENVTDMNTEMKRAEAAGMTCDTVMKYLVDYADSMAGRDIAGESDFNQNIRECMERHAESCPQCRMLLAQTVGLNELLDDVARDDAALVAPLEAQAAWRQAIRAEAAAQQGEQNERRPSEKRGAIVSMNRWANRWMRGIGTVAAALVVLVAGTYGMRMTGTPDAAEAPMSGDQAATQPMSQAANREQNPEMTWDAEGIYEEMYPGYVLMSANGEYNAAGLLISDGSTEDDQRQQNEPDATAAPSATQVTLSAENPGESNGESLKETEDGEAAAHIEPVVIRSAERSIESMNYERDIQWLEDLVSEYDAYYEEKSETAAAGQNGRVSSVVIRVPSERLDDFLTEMAQLGETVMTREKAEDVTGRYADVQSRLAALRIQYEKLNVMLHNAANVQELLAIDDKLTEVIAAMEMLEGDLRRWQSQQSYSKVTVTLTEVFEQPLTSEASLGERIQAGFGDSVRWLGDFAQDALVVLVSFLPRLVVWVPAAVLLGVIVWALRRGKKKD